MSENLKRIAGALRKGQMKDPDFKIQNLIENGQLWHVHFDDEHFDYNFYINAKSESEAINTAQDIFEKEDVAYGSSNPTNRAAYKLSAIDLDEDLISDLEMFASDILGPAKGVLYDSGS